MICLYTSFKKEHFIVAVGTLVALSIQLLSIVSTGLLVSQHNTLVHRPTALYSSDVLDNPPEQTLRIWNRVVLHAGQPLNTTAVSTYYGANSMKMPYPRWTLPQYAVQEFHAFEPSRRA